MSALLPKLQILSYNMSEVFMLSMISVCMSPAALWLQAEDLIGQED